MAEAIVRLTRLHRYARGDVLKMTPRELLATLAIADEQAMLERQSDFELALVAARGDEKALAAARAALKGEA